MTNSGITSSTISSSRRKWRVLLPITNLVVAVCLLLVGHYQQRTVSPQWSATATGGEWRPAGEAHLSPGTQVAYAINFPALLIASPLHTVNRTAVILGFFVALLIVWYVVGRVRQTIRTSNSLPFWLTEVRVSPARKANIVGFGLSSRMAQLGR